MKNRTQTASHIAGTRRVDACRASRYFPKRRVTVIRSDGNVEIERLYYPIDIPDLLSVVREWDAHVRSQLPGNALWYAPFELDGKTLVCDPPADHSRKCHNRFDGGLRSLCELAGVRYRSVHNFRHGFAVYGLKAAKDMADMEAVSKNLMHKSLKVTLEVYAVLGEGDVRDRIVKLRQ